MKKLIDLLNEYNKNHHNKSDLYYLFEIENGMLFCYDDVTDVQRTMQDEAMVICSKKFLFIQRLVKNDKIDFDNRELKDKFMEEFERYPTFHNNTYNQDFNINGLLMLLAIQDNPIEFLVSILK